MIIRHFDIKKPEVKEMEEDGWEQLPFGYYWMTKCRSTGFIDRIEELYSKMRKAGHMPGGQFQLDCLISILADINKDNVNFFELGAGWGRLCLELAGVINFKNIQCSPKRYHCLAVEAEPIHYKWLKEHFESQNINATTVFGAVSNKNGSIHFNVNNNPGSEYGQTIIPIRGRSGIPIIQNLFKIFTKKTVKVPMYTLDFLIQKYGFDHVDIVQMDIQGAEYDVIQGASNCIKEGIIDYFLINIHRDEYSNMIHSILSNKYSLIIDLKRAEIGTVEGFPPIQCHDGIQLYKRKVLCE